MRPTKEEALKQYFGYTAFREGQEALIDAQLSGRDVFGVMPTGGGKSICYQLPALLSEGVTLVVSPLISLMKDQVRSLKKAGVAAAYVNSSLTPQQIVLALRNILQYKYKIIYVAPERLLQENFLRVAQQLKIAMLVVDEAHCISQWGQDFRPSYLKIPTFLSYLDRRPVVSAFTATATQIVREDILRLLGLRDPLTVLTGFDRPNLRFEVMRPDNKQSCLLTLVRERKAESGVIYCSTRKEVEKVCELLRDKGYPATRYHAGLEDEERMANQDDFIFDRRRIMVATNAFGMGIDKSNIAYVIHYNMPCSIEAYYQEAGRAGRDGSPAECILLFAPGDVHTAKFLIEHPQENEELTEEERQTLLERDMDRLNRMTGYCRTNRCLRGYLLGYFGQRHPETCGNCGNCSATVTEKNVTTEAQMILSCVGRIKGYLGYPLGETLVIRTLHGSREKRITELGLDRLSTYGVLRHLSRTAIREITDALITGGYLHTDSHDALLLTAKADGVLYRKEAVTAEIREAVKPRQDARSKQEGFGERWQSPESGSYDLRLYETLRELRTRIAQRENVPVYVVFSNAALKDMAAKAPVTQTQFLEVSGVGNYKAERYGDEFIAEIRRYKELC